MFIRETEQQALMRSIAVKTRNYKRANKKSQFNALPVANVGYTFASAEQIQILEAYKLG